MRLSRPSRFVAAMLALVCVLFAQLAVAAYVCPSMEIAHAFESAGAAGTAHAPESTDCGDGDGEAAAPILCHDAGQTAKQSLDKPPLPNVSPFIARALVLAYDLAETRDQPTVPPTAGTLLSRDTAPPLAIRHCCFRI